jgi:AcrR family transcriptional regulator
MLRKIRAPSRKVTEHQCIVNAVSITTPSISRPGRPRNPEVQRHVVDAVLEMIGGGATLSSLSFVSIAEHAGVSRNSIYRRWKTKERLFVDVAKSFRRTVPDLDEHSARENLVMVLDLFFAHDIDPRVLRLEQAITAEAMQFPDVFESFADVVDVPLSLALKMAIRGGKDTGEIRVDVDENVLVAVLMSARRGRDDAGSQRLVDLVFDGVCPS